MSTPILMEALGYQSYEGRWYTIGQEIEVSSERDASDMEAMRLARRKPRPPAAEKQPDPEVIRREMNIVEPSEKKRDDGNKKRYGHREMRVKN